MHIQSYIVMAFPTEENSVLGRFPYPPPPPRLPPSKTQFYFVVVSAPLTPTNLAHQNRTIAIASDSRVDGAKSSEILQKEGVLDSDIADRNRKSLVTFHRTLSRNAALLSLISEIAAISGVRDGHRRKSQKSLQFRCAESHRFKVGRWNNTQGP